MSDMPMSDEEKAALDKGLAALDTLAAIWGAEIGIQQTAAAIAGSYKAPGLDDRIAKIMHQSFVEGAYRCYIDHKDQLDQLKREKEEAVALADNLGDRQRELLTMLKEANKERDALAEKVRMVRELCESEAFDGYYASLVLAILDQKQS